MLYELWQRWRGSTLSAPLARPDGSVQVLELGRLPGPLPFPGGWLDQPACVLEAFAIMDGAAGALRTAFAGPAP